MKKNLCVASSRYSNLATKHIRKHFPVSPKGNLRAIFATNMCASRENETYVRAQTRLGSAAKMAAPHTESRRDDRLKRILPSISAHVTLDQRRHPIPRPAVLCEPQMRGHIILALRTHERLFKPAPRLSGKTSSASRRHSCRCILAQRESDIRLRLRHRCAPTCLRLRSILSCCRHLAGHGTMPGTHRE